MPKPGPRLMAAAGLVLALTLAAGGAAAETLLHFSETATLTVKPDELVATLQAQANAPTAQEAQARVNAAMKDALAEAHRAAGIQVSTGPYHVWHAQQPRDQWQAGQSIELRSHDGTPLLEVVGRLQAHGLAVQQLDWQVSDALRQQTMDAARRQAISALRGRAEEAANLLGLRFESFKEVRLELNRSPIYPRAMMAAAAKAVAAPSAESEEIPVSATVEADAVLQPK